jgi:hypothetical protein
MMGRRPTQLLSVAGLSFAVAACGGPAAGPTAGPATVPTGGAGGTAGAVVAPTATLAELTTEVIDFEAASIPPDANQPLQPAACRASVRVPRAGAYACDTEAGAQLDPCFVIEGSRLGCQPNPVFQSWTALVEATGPLPDTTDRVQETVAIVVDLGLSFPSCTAGTASPKTLDGRAVSFSCQAPGAWLLGPLDRATPRWVAQYATTDSQGATLTSGPTPVAVVRAWVY